VVSRDWLEWHRPYDDPASALSRRLALVQHHLRGAMDRCRGPRVRIVSICAGQGRDVIGAVARHPRREDVRARLVELDPRNTEQARDAASAAGLEQISVVTGDAGTTDAYAGAVPADIVVLCGVFGNIVDDDVHQTVALLPMLCAAGATVVWTRHRNPPDLTPAIRGWFADAGFAEEAFDNPPDTFFGVGAHRLVREPSVFETGRQLFTFVGYDNLGT
jgi:hypothetical protein